jgi:hypothetical protein
MRMLYGSVYGWLAVLLLVCVSGPYLLRIRPRRPVDWVALTATIAFLVWLLGGFTSLRS